MVELIENEVYYLDIISHKYIVKCKDKGKKCNNINLSYNTFNKEGDIRSFIKHLKRLATSEEKHWLNECIKANKFIPFNELKFNKTYELW
jgi:hypothetical protein